MTDALRRYVTRGHTRVQGWLLPTAIALIIELARLQDRRHLSGAVCEIGVHHGRLFILLHLLTRGAESSVGWDLFEHQDQNVDRSGRGDRAKLLENLDKHGADGSRIRIETANSLDLTPDIVIAACKNRPRIFSVDGGHTAEITVSDLTLAAASTHEQGLIVLDDFFNESWPGVAEGTCAYMARPPIPLYPVAIGGNKFVFCKDREAARQYQQDLKLDKRFKRRVTSAFGHPVVVITPDTSPVGVRMRRTPTIKAFEKNVRRAVKKLRQSPK